MKHIFPFSEINKGMRIVLYGASERGYDFYRQLLSTGYCEIILWVDRQFEWYKYMNLPVDSPKKILEVEFDLVVVTAEQAQVYDSIREDLDRLGVDGGRIFWKKDCLIKGNVASGYDKKRVKKEAEDAFIVPPILFLNENRLDIAVRVLYAKDILMGRDNAKNRGLYRQLMMVQNDGKEPTENMMSSFFSEYSLKSGFKAFDDSFKDIIASMKHEGFKKEGFIPLDRSNQMINGAHRVAAAIAVGIDAWAYAYPVDVKELIFDTEWLLNNGFSNSETEYIEAAYRDMIS